MPSSREGCVDQGTGGVWRVASYPGTGGVPAPGYEARTEHAPPPHTTAWG